MQDEGVTVEPAADQPVFDEALIAMCGAYCGACSWRERTGCPGCRAVAGKPFWGECRMAGCAIGRGLEHCGLCMEVPCAMLREAFADPEHGDGGERLSNLRAWAKGERTYLELRRPEA